MKKAIWMAAALMLCLVLMAGCSAKDSGNGAEASGAGLTIEVSALSNDVAFFDYNAAGTAMQVIARMDDTGTPRLSYNTCQSCNGSPYAYFEVQNGVLVCRNCGNLFSFDSIGAPRQGGCMPIPVDDYTVEEGKITISAEVLDGMKSAFANWKKGL